MSSQASASESKSSAPIDIKRVRKLFAVQARIAESAFLRREVATRMHERLALVKLAPQRVLDAGCGEGSDLITLQRRFPGAQVLGLDASAGMLTAARDNHLAARSSVNRLLKKWLPPKVGMSSGSHTELLCGDFAQLPFGVKAVDLVWSNLALHWHPQPDRIFAEWRRVLRVDGLLMFSCFGPDTFKELRTAFAEIDGMPHALPFVDMHDFGDMLVNAGFSTPVMDMETIMVTYESVEKLMADVRAWGGNPLATRRRSLIGKDAWKRVVGIFEKMRRSDGRIPLTFEVIYGHAFRPVPRVTASGETIIRLDRNKK
ncbi:MAG: methyltransferase domain-containing protein [Burkholderiaceae bacterium]